MNADPCSCWLCGEPVLKEECIKILKEDNTIYLHWECVMAFKAMQKTKQT